MTALCSKDEESRWFDLHDIRRRRNSRLVPMSNATSLDAKRERERQREREREREKERERNERQKEGDRGNPEISGRFPRTRSWKFQPTWALPGGTIII